MPVCFSGGWAGGTAAWGCLQEGLCPGRPGARLATGRRRGCAQGLLTGRPGGGIEVQRTGHRCRPFTVLCGVTAVMATSRECAGREPGQGWALVVVGRARLGRARPGQCWRAPLRLPAVGLAPTCTAQMPAPAPHAINSLLISDLI